MDSHTKYSLLMVLCFFCAIITLGGIGYAIKDQGAFYIIPLIVNILVYGAIGYKLYLLANPEEKKKK